MYEFRNQLWGKSGNNYPLFTLFSIYFTEASGAKQMPEKNSSDET